MTFAPVGVRCPAYPIRTADHAANDNATGQNRLWGFFVPATASAAEPTDLKLFLTNRLPDQMIPAGLTCIESLPLTPNGKLDRTALPSLLPKFAEPPEERAMTSREAQLLNICQEVLHYPALRVDEDLLDSGFHSLAFAQLAWHIQKKFGVPPAFSDLFKRRTVAEIAALVEEAGPKDNPVSEPIAAAHKPLDVPLSFAQERVWFLEKLHPGSLAYNFQSLLRFHGSLDVRALQTALNVVVERHEILRTSFPQAEGRPYQRIHVFVRFKLPVEDVRAEEAEQQIATIIRTPFDLERVPPVRWVLFQLRPDEHWLLNVEHHLLHDGWGYEVFLRELFTCYSAFLEGRSPNLPPPRHTVRRFRDLAAATTSGRALGSAAGILDAPASRGAVVGTTSYGSFASAYQLCRGAASTSFYAPILRPVASRCSPRGGDTVHVAARCVPDILTSLHWTGRNHSRVGGCLRTPPSGSA